MVRLLLLAFASVLASCATDPYLDCGARCAPDGAPAPDGRIEMASDGQAQDSSSADSSSDSAPQDSAAQDSGLTDSGLKDGGVQDSGVTDAKSDADASCKMTGVMCSSNSECCSHDCQGVCGN